MGYVRFQAYTLAAVGIVSLGLGVALLDWTSAAIGVAALAVAWGVYSAARGRD